MSKTFNSEIFFLPSSNSEDETTETIQKPFPDHLTIFDNIVSQLPEMKIINGFLGEVDGQQYALVSDDYRSVHGYELGDEVKVKLKVSNEELLPSQHSFKIGGFIAPEVVLRSTIFTDYDYLFKKGKKKGIVDIEDPVYNIVFTSGAETHLERFAVIDLFQTIRNYKENLEHSGSTDDNLDFSKIPINIFKLVNQKSLTLTKFDILITYHYKIFQIFLTIILLFNIAFTILLLFLITFFLFETNKKMFITLRTFGYKVRELIS